MRTENKKFVLSHNEDEEVKIGDTIVVNLSKDFNNRSVCRKIEFMLTEATLPLALELDIIKEVITENKKKEEEEEEESINNIEELKYLVDDHEQMIGYLTENLEAAQKEIKKLRKEITKVILELDRVKLNGFSFAQNKNIANV